MSLTISSGPLSMELDHTLGGCVRRMDWRGKPILRPAPKTDAPHPTACAAFPMVPFSGRIANGRFKFDGTPHQLPENLPPEPHCIHGFGWQDGWKIAACDTRSATLRYVPEVSPWPWRFEARQIFSLSETEMRLTLTLENRGGSPMPAGFGWHPYFPRADAEIQADTHMVWLSDDKMIPTPPVLVSPHFDLSRTRPVDQLEMDHVFSVGSRVQHLSWPDRVVTMSSDPVFSKLVVYIPPGEDFFCVEPASHVPDAVNSALPGEQTGLAILQPGELMHGTIRLNVTPVEPA